MRCGILTDESAPNEAFIVWPLALFGLLLCTLHAAALAAHFSNIFWVHGMVNDSMRSELGSLCLREKITKLNGKRSPN